MSAADIGAGGRSDLPCAGRSTTRTSRPAAETGRAHSASGQSTRPREASPCTSSTGGPDAGAVAATRRTYSAVTMPARAR